MKLFTLLALFGCTAAQVLRGVNWGHRLDQTWNDAIDCKSPEQFEREYKQMSTYASAVKIYSCGECLAGPQSLKLTQKYGMQLFLGVTADPKYFPGDFAVLQNMTETYGLSNVLGISVGTEDLYRGDVPTINAESIVSQIKQLQQYLRSKGYSTPVTHVDAIGADDTRWGDIRAVQDIYMYNYFPFWMGINVNGGLPATQGAYYDIQKNFAQGKPVWIGEIGWPTGGYNKGDAIADEANAGIYFSQFVCWANANNIIYFYYEMFDEPWKLTKVGATGPIEQNFGLFYFNETAKSFANLQCSGGQPAKPIPVPTTSAVQIPATSVVQVPTTSAVQVPATSAVQVPATSAQASATVGNSAVSETPAKPSTSAAVAQTSTFAPDNTVARPQSSAMSLVIGVSSLIAVALFI